jgi:hypothetical protein
VALTAAVIGLLYFGIQPVRLLHLARQTSETLAPAPGFTAPAVPPGPGGR